MRKNIAERNKEYDSLIKNNRQCSEIYSTITKNNWTTK